MKTYEALAQGFVDEGTSTVFGMTGEANQHWINALVQRGVSMHEVRHEGAGLAMAEGWARTTGTPGTCTTTSGPGTSHLATSLLVASRTGTPLLVFSGDTPVGEHDATQAFDQRRFAAATECGFVRLDGAESAYEVVQRAFYTARLESRPVMLSAPSNVQQQPFDDTEEYLPSRSLLTASPIHPELDRLSAAADVVAGSERPVIIVGRGARAAGAADAVLQLAEHVGALIATSLLTINWLRDRCEYHAGVSGLYSTRAAMELFQEADCVIAVGASLNYYTTEHGYLFPNARFVHIDVRPQVVMGDGRAADCYVRADARVAVEILNSLLEDRRVRSIGYRTPETKQALDRALDDPEAFDLAPGTIDPRDACRIIDEAMPPAFGLVSGGGHQANFGTLLFTRPRPLALYNKSFGCIGMGLPNGIGAVLASEVPTFVMEGDAGFMMNLAEFDTAVRCRLPLLVVVLNDQGLGIEVLNAKVWNLDPEIVRIPSPDLGAVGAALGGRGALVRDARELRQALDEFVANPSPSVIDVRISPNVVSIPERRRLLGQDNV